MAETLSLTPQMMVILGLLGLTIALFAFEILRVDLAALTVLVLLGLLSVVPALHGLADPMHLFDGFGIGQNEIVVTANIFLAAKVFGGQVLGLQAGAHSAIKDEHAFFECVEVFAVGVGSVGHRVFL